MTKKHINYKSVIAKFMLVVSKQKSYIKKEAKLYLVRESGKKNIL